MLKKLYNRALELRQQKQFSEAAAILNQLLNEQPNNAAIHGQLGQAYQQQQKLTDAVVHYQECLKFQPNLAEIHYNLASCYLMLGKRDEALKHYLRAYFITPDADAAFNAGVIYMHQERHRDAIDYFTQATKLQPDYYAAHINMATIYLKNEQYDQALACYQTAKNLQPNNEEIEFIISAINQEETPKQAPDKFIKDLFDQYAPHFDQHLKDYLDYQAPQQLLDATYEILGDKSPQWKILDLGCGTGLCGAKFKPLAHELIGIDLSEKMIVQAKQKAIYDVLETTDILSALKKYQALDLIIAGDVFGYIGDLEKIFEHATKALTKDGLFLFTIERTFDEDYTLKKSIRYTHSEHYINSLAKRYGLNIATSKLTHLRRQQNNPVEGMLFVLQRT